MGPPRLFPLPPTYGLYPGVLRKAGPSPPLGHQGSPGAALLRWRWVVPLTGELEDPLSPVGIRTGHGGCGWAGEVVGGT